MKISRILAAATIAILLLATSHSPAGAHLKTSSVAGTCPHHSSSSHANGAGLAAISPRGWGSSHSVCQSSRIKAWGDNVDFRAGWHWTTVYGDPGRLWNFSVDTLGLTKHEVYISPASGAANYWGGVTLVH